MKIFPGIETQKYVSFYYGLEKYKATHVTTVDRLAIFDIEGIYSDYFATITGFHSNHFLWLLSIELLSRLTVNL